MLNRLKESSEALWKSLQAGVPAQYFTIDYRAVDEASAALDRIKSLEGATDVLQEGSDAIDQLYAWKQARLQENAALSLSSLKSKRDNLVNASTTFMLVRNLGTTCSVVNILAAFYLLAPKPLLLVAGIGGTLQVNKGKTICIEKNNFTQFDLASVDKTWTERLNEAIAKKDFRQIQEITDIFDKDILTLPLQQSVDLQTRVHLATTDLPGSDAAIVKLHRLIGYVEGCTHSTASLKAKLDFIENFILKLIAEAKSEKELEGLTNYVSAPKTPLSTMLESRKLPVSIFTCEKVSQKFRRVVLEAYNDKVDALANAVAEPSLLRRREGRYL